LKENINGIKFFIINYEAIKSEIIRIGREQNRTGIYNVGVMENTLGVLKITLGVLEKPIRARR
jgi:hypothetical protein